MGPTAPRAHAAGALPDLAVASLCARAAARDPPRRPWARAAGNARPSPHGGAPPRLPPPRSPPPRSPPPRHPPPRHPPPRGGAAPQVTGATAPFPPSWARTAAAPRAHFTDQTLEARPPSPGSSPVRRLPVRRASSFCSEQVPSSRPARGAGEGGSEEEEGNPARQQPPWDP